MHCIIDTNEIYNTTLKLLRDVGIADQQSRETR